MDERPVGGEVPKKICPRCRNETFTFIVTCPACGFVWPDTGGSGEKPPREPGRRLLFGVLIALLGLLGSFCLLYVVLSSFAKRAS